MTVRTEYAALALERDKVAARQARKSATATAFALWFVRMPPADHFVWRDLDSLIPIPGDTDV